MSLGSFKINLRWSDLDPNFHLSHSSFYDLASQARFEMLARYGLTLAEMEELQVTPILHHEECFFYREIKYNDVVYIEIRIKDFSEDLSRWTLEHEFIGENKKRRALLTTDISWFNFKTRKLAKPLPEALTATFKSILAASGS